MTRPTTPDPAIKSYFFDKGYRDLGATIAESWRRNLASAQEHFAKVGRLMPGEAGDKALAILWGTAGISVVVFGTAVFLVASAVHILILFTFFLLIYLGFSLVYLIERAYLTWKGFFPVCPDCHSKNPLAEYFCPGCGACHRRLTPSSYGILHHTCECGQKLPATFFLKRGELPSSCPDCKRQLETGHIESRKVFIPIFGGPSVGKSAFLFSAVDQLIEHASQQGLLCSFLDSRTESDLARVRQQLSQGLAPEKTIATLPRAFNLKIEAAGRDPRVLYLYDPAGEAFNETEGLVLHRYQSYLSGLILLVDPFAIADVQAEYGERMADVRDALKPSKLPLEVALSRLLIGFEEHFGLGKGDRIKVPVAVVVNKVDAFDLEQKIGDAAVAARLGTSPTALSSEAARDALVREQLGRWDQGVVQQLETRCARLRFFACSALGRMPDGSAQPFEARGVIEPLLWILSQSDSVFAAERQAAA